MSFPSPAKDSGLIHNAFLKSAISLPPRQPEKGEFLRPLRGLQITLGWGCERGVWGRKIA